MNSEKSSINGKRKKLIIFNEENQEHNQSENSSAIFDASANRLLDLRLMSYESLSEPQPDNLGIQIDKQLDAHEKKEMRGVDDIEH